MNNKYAVSIIVPCYNVLAWIDQCLYSLVNQTLQTIEIITVNDGSTDATGEKLDKWSTQYADKIKVVHKTNGGVASARNVGIKIATGKYISFVDADDWCDLTMLEKLYTKAKETKKKILFCNFYSYDQIHNTTKINKIIKKPSVNKLAIRDTNFLEIPTVWGSLFLHDFICENNFTFNENLYIAEDFVFFARLLKETSVYIINEALYFYRRNRYNQLTSITDDRIFVRFKAFSYIRDEKIFQEDQYLYNYLLRIQISVHAYTITVIKKNFFMQYLSNASYDIFKNYSLLKIYKNTVYLTFTKDCRFFAFILLLNVVYFFKKARLIS